MNLQFSQSDSVLKAVGGLEEEVGRPKHKWDGSPPARVGDFAHGFETMEAKPSEYKCGGVRLA